MAALVCNHQPDTVPDESKQQPKKFLKRTSSTVFSWPSFVTSAHTRDLMVPIKSLVQVKATDTVRSVLWGLIKSKVDCVPVYNDATRKYVGFVDMFDIVLYIANAAGSAAVKPDFFQIFKRQSFGDVPITKITSSHTKDHLSSVSENSLLSEVFDLTVSANLPRVPVMNKKVLGMISQAKVVQFLSRNKSNFHQLASMTISQLALSGTDNVYTVEENSLSVNAFIYMNEKGVRGLAIVNSEGQFVDSINSFDAKGLVQGDVFSDLRQPVLRFLSKSRILLGRNLAPVVCTPQDTLGDIIDKMAQERIYRVFVIDEDKKPKTVLSLRDILKVLHAYVPEPEPEAEEPEPEVEADRLLYNLRRSLAGSGGF